MCSVDQHTTLFVCNRASVLLFIGRSIITTYSRLSKRKKKRNNYEHDIWVKQQFISQICKRIAMKQIAQHIPVGIFRSWIQFFAAFHGLVARKTFSVEIPLIRVYPRFKLIQLDSSLFFVGELGFWPRIWHCKSDKGNKNSQSKRCKTLYTPGSRVNIGLRLTFWRHKLKRWPISEQANNFQDAGMLSAFLAPLSGEISSF